MRPLVTAFVIIAAACTGTSTTSAPPTTATARQATTAPTAAAVTEAAVDPCPGEEPGPTGEFAAAGPVASFGSATGDAGVVAEIRLTTPRPGSATEADPDACERLVIDLATATGAPATAVGPTRVELLADIGIVRVILPPAVTTTGVADLTMAGNIAERAFVVEGEDGLFIDVHLSRPATARAAATRSPARVVIDLLGGGVGPESGPALGESAVVLAPLGPMATYPIEVTGYARADAGGIEIRVTGSAGSAGPIEVLAPVYPWRVFAAVVASGPRGQVRLSVGNAVVLLAVP